VRRSGFFCGGLGGRVIRPEAARSEFGVTPVLAYADHVCLIPAALPVQITLLPGIDRRAVVQRGMIRFQKRPASGELNLGD
jgi:hypothetical protein